MRIGLCTTDFSYKMKADELFAKVADMGFECVQLAFASVGECDYEPTKLIEIPESVSIAAVDAITRASAKYGVSVVAVNGTWNMAHPDAAVREEGLRRCAGFLRAVADTGCSIASLCTGTRCREHLWRYDALNTTVSAWSDMSDSVRRMCDIAEKENVTLAIETEASNIINTPEKARKIMDETGSDKLKMILDCANLFGPGEASIESMRPMIDKAVKYFGSDIVLAHGKDIRPSDGIDFCGTGFGIVDFEYMLRALSGIGYTGDMVLHGIYDESDMPKCLMFMRGRLANVR